MREVSELATGARHGGGEAVAVTGDAEGLRVANRGGDIRGGSATHEAVLEGDVSVGVDGDVGVGRARVEGLAEDEDGFFVGWMVAGRKDDGGGEGGVAGDAGPGETESVRATPHVGSAAGELIGVGYGAVGGGAGLGDADVSGVGKKAGALWGSWLRRGDEGCSDGRGGESESDQQC